ncbi:phosphodiester glycosidase family protein, partial [Actinophytocola sp.]|uniref:phosphodiester glycosidase family protein n=1 Tax=Actinophytocola sp. TaxID=1872138 RepID=UPI002EDA2A8A
ALRLGIDTVTVTRALAPVAPRVAVGGLPVLLREGAIDPQVDSAGNAGFRGVNPRTAIAVADAGRRLLLVTVDGRQPGRSVGISLRDLAALLQSLGARDAINLDGGGSTTMVANGRVVNKPSDAAGQRPVGDAILVLP